MKFLIALTVVNVIVSASTLAVLGYALKRIQKEVDTKMINVNNSFGRIKDAIDAVEI